MPYPPSMDSLLSSPEGQRLAAAWGREALKEELRRAMSAGQTLPGALTQEAEGALKRRWAPTLTRVLNGTGVLLHTNLGRSPLCTEARTALAAVLPGYAAVEFDPATGGRGRRQDHVREAARDLFGVGDAIAVNNNAAAVFLALAALARGRPVLVSRGELVAIGGSFQIPEILEASGAQLVEVGTTNRTTLDDYRRALDERPALLLTVHPSNYEIRGFTQRPEPRALAALAREGGIPWLHDQGTGCVEPLDEFGVRGEPTVASCLADGADLVTFSGDKLFAGPQAGFVAGRADLVARLLSHPVARVVRPDKLTLAALAATLHAWKRGRWRDFPVYRAAAASLESLEERGAALKAALARRAPGLSTEVVPAEALFGGGTSPEKTFASRALAVAAPGVSPDALAARWRAQPMPLIGRVALGRALVDLRSIPPEEDGALEDVLASSAGPV
ncbi:MAG: L-seryl-tRNA(Sec) selenium transferase [Thermoanaerobaculia bacterium]